MYDVRAMNNSTQKTPSVRHQPVSESSAGQRLDNFLLKILKGVPKTRIYRVIRKGEVRVDGKRAKADTRLQAEQVVRIPPIRVAEHGGQIATAAQGQTLLAKRIFEDSDILVINKPAGLSVHGGSGCESGVIERLRATEEYPYLELVHRLDRQTSGVLLIAKKASVLKRLQADWNLPGTDKIYEALVCGAWRGHKRVALPLKKVEIRPREEKVIVATDGKMAITTVEILQSFREATHLSLGLETGRMHQLRVHTAHLGHPIIGDEKYGRRPLEPRRAKMPRKRLFLHAKSLQIPGYDTPFEAPLPPYFQDAFDTLQATQ